MMPDPAKILAFKRQLKELVTRARYSVDPVLTQQQVATRANVGEATLSKAFGETSPMPSAEVTDRIVRVSQRLLHPDNSDAELDAEVGVWHRRWLDASRPRVIHDPPEPTAQPTEPPEPEPTEQPTEQPVRALGPGEESSKAPGPGWSGRRAWLVGLVRRRPWLAASVVVIAVIVVVAGLVVGLRPSSVSAADHRCVAAGLSMAGTPAECVGVTGPELFDQFDPALTPVIDQITAQNRAASSGGDYVDVALLGPLTQSPTLPGQLSTEQARQMLIGAAVAQQRANSGSSPVGSPRPRIRLLLANVGSQQDQWHDPVDKLIKLAGDPGQRLVAVIALGTSVNATRDAAKALTQKGIPVIGAITTADELDYTHIPGMIRVVPDTSDLVAALADYLHTRPGLDSALVVWDDNSETRGDLYTGSLTTAFNDQLGSWIGTRRALEFTGESIPSNERPDMFYNTDISICQSDAKVILYAGRIGDLEKFIEALSTRNCADRPMVIMTASSALTHIDRTMTDELRAAKLTIVYAGVVDPHTWSLPDGNPPRGYTDYLTALTTAGFLAADADAYTCLTHDAVFTAARAARLATPPTGKTQPNHDEVRGQLRNIHDAFAIPGCTGGTFSFSTVSHGNPEGTPTPIVIIPADADHPDHTRYTTYPR
ncbi:ABC transporter substrate-binding protein [Nocardia sp. NPDC059239]|uniref:ABC transporter substrate-binding protein n=1 Tax=unclassified Nocardia TaxID=2637762 RepID=UPI0036A64A22